MAVTKRTLFVCSCEETMPLDLKAMAVANPDVAIVSGRAFCGSEIERLTRHALDSELTIACTYQAPILAEALADAGREKPATYANIREMAGWSREAAKAGPKIAALIAAAEEPAADIPIVSLESDGVALVLGRDESVLEIAERLAGTLDITVLVAADAAVPPPRALEFPVFRGKARTATGRLGAFELTVDGFAAPAPSSRGALAFGVAKNGATSRCDVLIDLTGSPPLFPAHDLRPGYLRADPADGAGVERLIADARDLVGTFDKPRYVAFKPELCAHSRSRITGCMRCLDVCPTGAITPDGDAVAIDAAICAGCGSCGSVCPTGAATYALPSPDAAMRRLRSLLLAYGKAGGAQPVVLLHDADHGEALIHALSHHGDGLPANVLPMQVNEPTQIGIEWLAAAAAYGARGVRILTRGKPRHDETALHTTRDLGQAILSALGFEADAVDVIATDDPDALGAALAGIAPGAVARTAATFLPYGGKRQVQRLALRELNAVAPAPAVSVPLPPGAPLGRVVVNAEGCTLCLACVSGCPTGALKANPERPELSFVEDLCVQCGICARTCPEKVIALEPRLDFAAIDASPAILKQEEPHACEHCGKLFGTKATIARIRQKLGGAHWMFSGANADRLKLIGLCDDCRVTVATTSAMDPYAGPERPKVKTSEDYFAEREAARRKDS